MELWGAKIPDNCAEATTEKPFQEWIGKYLRDWLDRNYQGFYRVKIEPQGGKVVPVRAFETSFWPDVSVESADGEPLVAIELKCLKRKGLPALVSQALGQALMYQQVYPQSLVVLVPMQPLAMPPPPFFANLAEHEIEVTVVGSVSGAGITADAP